MPLEPLPQVGDGIPNDRLRTMDPNHRPRFALRRQVPSPQQRRQVVVAAD